MKRHVITVRVPAPLVRKLDDATKQRRRILGTPKWSRNDEIVARLEASLKEQDR